MADINASSGYRLVVCNWFPASMDASKVPLASGGGLTMWTSTGTVQVSKSRVNAYISNLSYEHISSSSSSSITVVTSSHRSPPARPVLQRQQEIREGGEPASTRLFDHDIIRLCGPASWSAGGGQRTATVEARHPPVQGPSRTE